ncbi:putative phage tail protein [Conservatibacter flavescens]|uniref:Phage tail protein n=1 Tax=Conservatibacter flavescens TaxID=28161 RepID=A0A2M8S513_9PAST|nr:putative phage tail protein [Conservatibacter flavescens]PJG86224.1 phage tail protein [Conservatibacter flavescens]
MANLQSEHAKALGRLLPPVSYNVRGEFLYRSLLIDGLQLDRVHVKGLQVLEGINPLTGVMIGDWERVTGLIKNKNKPLDERIKAVIDKLNDQASLSIPYIVDKAKQLGYTIKIIEPEPFRAGESWAGEVLWDEGVKWMFFVDIGVPEVLYRGEYRLDLYGVDMISDPVFEALLNQVQPAYTKYWIRYYNG